jgi:CheY-like chemotaxis protein
MWLESVVGQGSIFRFTARFEPAMGAKEPGETEVGSAPEQVLHVLLAEDNIVNRRLAVRQIEKYGHVVTAIGNGREALEASADGNFDVILMDVHMPEMDGIEATRQIRQREQDTGRHVPIIALTAGAMTQDREACLAAGMDAYLSKPINPAELLATVASVLGSSRSEPLAV